MAEIHENYAKDDATVDVVSTSQHPTLEAYERLFGVDEDSYEQPTTSRKELWSYYLYYNGDNGVGPGSYSQALFQWALNGAGHQPGSDPPKACTDSSACVVPWTGGARSVSSVVLIANGLCFTFMTVIFVWLGSAADYGTFGRWLLLALTVVCWALQYGMMSIRHPSQWPTAMGLYVVAYIAYGATLVFYAAVFPRLARYTPHVRKAREEDLREGKIDQEEYDAIESLERNHISNISTAHSNIGYLLTLVLNLSVLLPLQNNNFSNNLALCLTNSYWVVLGIWWFIFQQKRPGPKIPKGSSYSTIGFKQIWLAIREIRSLPQTFLYFFAYFLLADGLNTTAIKWEFYFYNVVFGLFQAPYYAYAQTMISELMPRGYDNMFFALFGITNRASSIIGPNVIQAIINDTHNSWMGFPFLFAICTAAMITICFVDVKKGREDCRKYTEQRKIDRVVAESGLNPNDIASGKQPVRNENVPEVQNEYLRSLVRG
ncbi:hypothetical protein PENCOP_c001G08446 [Penicillium coprophilum]|uniref:Autophagy-related protein n=1 Tax=Penicillium coprophilum TaxID=36646 RepID=A0A1V6V7P5_9EURO|nr:hypothetical protein PENCOP_c001G08446 [Penicillium coprophilum]